MITIQLSPNVEGLLTDIASQGEAYLVGGAVRDYFRGTEIGGDIDVATNVDVETLKSYLRSKGYRVVSTGSDIERGAEFGVFLVALPNGETVDIAQFRAEQYDPKTRKPLTSPVKTIQEDLARRDAPINAIALKYLGGNNYEVIDPYGGREDIKKGVVRAVGEASARISDDPLRALRYIGFASRFGYQVDPVTLQAIKDNLNRMDVVSRERIHDEIIKRLKKGNVARYFELLHDSGLLTYLFPEFVNADNVLHDNRGTHHGESVYEHTREVLARIPDSATPEFKLAALLHDIGKVDTGTVEDSASGMKRMFVGHDKRSAEIAQKRLTELRFPSSTINYVRRLAAEHMNLNTVVALPKPKKPLADLVLNMHEDYPLLKDLVDLTEVDSGIAVPQIKSLVEQFSKMPTAITGENVLQYPPKSRGAILRQMRYLQLTQGLGRDSLLNLLGGEANNILVNMGYPLVEAQSFAIRRAMDASQSH